MGEREDLQAAIAALEVQRPTLGGAVDTALRALRARLEQLTAASRSESMKLVTVVFSDLVGFTALSEAMDPEEVRELTAGYFRAWTETVESHGGVVEKFIGDAVLSVFGLPIAREDDAQRAVTAAWQMVTGGLTSVHPRLTMRVGVNTGRTLVSTLDERRGDFVVVGDVVNTASRLQTAAPVGGVLLSEETWRLVRKAFRADPQPPLEVKGKREPLRTFVVAGPQPHRFRLDATVARTPLVGRDDERARLAAALDEVYEPGATLRTIVISGEAGIGKSRLIAEVDADLEADARPFIFLRARAASAQGEQAGALLRDLSGSRFDLVDGEHIDVALRKFRAGVAAIVPLSPEEQVALETIVGLSGSGHADHRDAEAVRYVGVRALARVLSGLADRRPIVMLIEDLHWADQASLDSLARVLDRVADRSILVVATARPEWDGSRSWPGTGRRDILELGPLAADATERLAEALGDGNVEPSLLRRVAATAEGNPFYIEELIRVVGDPRWRAQEREMAVPATLTGVLQARLETLDLDQRNILQSGAVIGRIFWTAPLAEMSRDVPNVPQRLLTLEEHDFVHPRLPSAFPGSEEFSFKHALLREVTLESLLATDRRRRHAVAAAWLEATTGALGRSDDYAAVIAGHHGEAGHDLPAARWYIRAGELAAAQFANVDALANYESAVDRLRRAHGEGALPADTMKLLFDVLLRIDRLHDLIADRTARQATLDRLSALAPQLDEVAQATVLLRTSEHAENDADYPEADQLARRAMALAEESTRDDPEANELRAAIEHQLGVVSWRWSRLTEAETHLQRAIGLAVAHGLPYIEATATRLLGLVADSHANYPAATAQLRRALELAEQIDDRRLQARCHNSLGAVLLNAGMLPDVEYHLRESLRIGQEIGAVRGASASRHNLAILLFERGDLVAAKQEFEALVAEGAADADREAHSAALMGLGAAALLLGDQKLAEATLLMACDILVEIGDEPALSETLTYRARLARETGHLDEARTLLEDAEGRVAGEGYHRDQAFALAELARVELEQGRAIEALGLARRARTFAADDVDCAIASEAAIVASEADAGSIADAITGADHLVARLHGEATLTGERPWAWRAAAEVYLAAGLAERAHAAAVAGWDEVLAQASKLEPATHQRFLDRPDHRALRRLAGRTPR